jgi:O-antigen ligase
MLPLGILAIIGLFMLFGLLQHRGTFNSADNALTVLPRCLLFIWLPMLISLIDAEYPQQVLKVVGLYPVYGLMALAVVVLLRANSILRPLAILLSWIVCIWAFDGVAQTLLGIDMFNIPLDRAGVDSHKANAFFSSPNKYGFYMGMMAAIPLFTMYLCGANRLTHIAVSLLLASAVLVGASRGAWVMFICAFVVYVYLVFVKGSRRPLIPIVIIPALASLVFWTALQFGSGMQERVQRFNGFLDHANYQTFNTALSGRVDIYSAAWDIGKAHPINGVGVDSFDKVYADYLPKDAMWQTMVGAVPPHPHQVILEVWSGAGVIGLFGFLLVWASMWRLWRQATPEQRKLALPVLMPLVVLWWPINTHRGFYSSELAVLSLFFLALSIAALTQRSDSK